MITFVRVPMVNVNDEEMLLVEWLKEPGSLIQAGEQLAVLETTKSTYELLSEDKGFLHIFVDAGETVQVSQIIAALATQSDEPVSLPEEPQSSEVASTDEEPQWTKKAEIVAKRHGIDIAALAMELKTKIKESDVLALVNGKSVKSEDVQDYTDDLYPYGRQQRILIIGAGQAGVQVLDLLNANPHQRAVGLVDDDTTYQGRQVMGVPIVGSIDDVPSLWQDKQFDMLAISIGNPTLRAKFFNQFSEQSIPFANVISPQAIVLSNVKLGTGNIINDYCRVASCSEIGDNNFLSAYVSLEHHNKLGSHCSFGPGVLTSGTVHVGDRVRFATGIFIEPGLQIGDDAIIASGVAITTSVPPNTIVKTKANFHMVPRNS